MSAHPHAANMRLYAEDAAETNKPWERWRYLLPDSTEWQQLGGNPHWYSNHKYERIPAPFDLRAHVRKSFPTLRDDHRFHRDDFTADMLPDGWRPLLLGETGDYEYVSLGIWSKGEAVDVEISSGDNWSRTTRPLPVLTPQQIAAGWIEWHGGECPVEPESIPIEVMFRLSGITDAGKRKASEFRWGHDGGSGDIIAYRPDPYGHLRKALADGKTVEYSPSGDGDWYKLGKEGAGFVDKPDRYRIKPEQQWLPLGPEDVPPGSVFRRSDLPFTWVATMSTGCAGVMLSRDSGPMPWALLEAKFEINRSIAAGKWDPTAWEPCRKEAQ